MSGAFSTPGEGVLLIAAIFGDFLQTFDKFLRRIEVRESLREVYCMILEADAGHSSDDGICEGVCTVG